MSEPAAPSPEPRQSTNSAIPAALAVIAGLVSPALATVWLDPALGFERIGFGPGSLALWLNILPVTALGLIILALFRRPLLAGWLTTLLVVALYAGNQAKFDALETPLLPADFRLFTAPGPVIELLSKYVHMDALRWALVALGLLATLALALFRPLRALRGGRGLLFALATGLLGASLVAGSAPWQRLYDPWRLGFQPWALVESTQHTGIVAGLLLYQWQIGGGGIPSPDQVAARTLLRRYVGRLSPEATPATLPDIVVVQSESLFDPSRVTGTPEGHWLPQFRRVARRATSGDMRVPTFVGGTIRTEFEVLTGAPLASLGGIQYPWLELARTDFPNLATVLAEQGYEPIAIHPNPASFWNRDRTYPELGFSRFIDAREFEAERIVGLFISDAALTDRILEELPTKGPPRFLFAISMENHGPFDWRPNLDPARLAAQPMPDGLDEGGRLWFRNYLYLLEDADHELGRLADALRTRRRRTLLLFYGDHLPGLAPVYYQLGFKDGRDALEQPVPWLLLDTARRRPARLDTHSFLLPGLLLHAAGIRDGGWFDLLAAFALDPDFDPEDVATAAGLKALAQLQLRGELAELLAAEMPESGAGVTAAGKRHGAAGPPAAQPGR